MPDTYTPTDRTRLKRKTHRGVYDAAVIHSILDAGLIAHVGFIHDGEAVVTPTAYWREGSRVYWHGAAAGRALPAQLAGRVSFTVSLMDGLVLGRSGIAHSLQYRSVMAFGRPELMTDPAAKRRAMDAFIDGLYPGRPAEVRPTHDAELAAISIVSLVLEEVSAKVKADGALEVASDLNAACWAGVVPVRAVLGEPVPDPRMRPGTPITPSLAAYRRGRPLEEALGKRGV